MPSSIMFFSPPPLDKSSQISLKDITLSILNQDTLCHIMSVSLNVKWYRLPKALDRSKKVPRWLLYFLPLRKQCCQWLRMFLDSKNPGKNPSNLSRGSSIFEGCQSWNGTHTVEAIEALKWDYADHVARYNDERWTTTILKRLLYIYIKMMILIQITKKLEILSFGFKYFLTFR